MADAHRNDPQPLHRYDEELDYKSIISFAVVLTLVTLLVLALMWGMGVVFKEAEQAKDPPPSPMAEALIDPIPPGPRLQSAPPKDMDEMRVQDRDTLGTYGWVDQSGGVARIPIDRAMSIIVRKGVAPAAEKKEPK